MKTKVFTSEDLAKSKKVVIEEINTPQQPENGDLLKAFNELKAENESLKANKPKIMDFEEAAKLFKEKGLLLDEIAKLESSRMKIINTNIKEQTPDNSLDSYYYSICLSYGSRSEPVFKISNIIVIDEFLDFVCNKLTTKIDDLKAKVQMM